MSLDDPARFRQRFRDELDRLDDADIADADKDAIHDFIRARDGGLAVSSLEQYCKQLRIVAGFSETPISDLDLDGARDLFFEIRHNDGCAHSTSRNRQRVLRIFLEHHAGEWAEQLEVMPVEKTTVDADDMLSSDDIATLVAAANNQRDIALIEFLADSGARRTLTVSLRNKDVDLEGETATYRPNADAIGLKGAEIKDYPLIDSVAAMRSYKRFTHPCPDDPEAPFFHKLENFEDGDRGINPDHLHNHLGRIARRTDLEKPCNPHNFRHSAVTRMVREGYTREEIEHRVHWKLNTDMWETYVHIDAERFNRDIFRKAGVAHQDDDDAHTRERHPCGVCREPLAPHHEYCPVCGEPATKETRELQKSATKSAAKGLAELSAAERRAFVADMLGRIQDDGSLLGTHESPSSSSESASESSTSSSSRR